MEGQLHQAQRMESIGQLAGGIAHDFNNLLMVISNYAEWALEQVADNEPLRKDVEEIRKAADRAAALTHQLLIFSRREPAEPKIIDLNTTIAGMQEMLGRTLGEHISFQTRSDARTVRGRDRPGAARAGDREPGAQREGRDGRGRTPCWSKQGPRASRTSAMIETAWTGSTSNSG